MAILLAIIIGYQVSCIGLVVQWSEHGTNTARLGFDLGRDNVEEIKITIIVMIKIYIYRVYSICNFFSTQKYHVNFQFNLNHENCAVYTWQQCVMASCGLL